MSLDTKRIILFLGLCIPIRISFIFLAKNITKDYLKYLSLPALILAFGFISIYILDLRKTGIEVGNSKIWWNDLRPIHGLLYLLFAIYAYKENDYSYIPLILDVILGVISFFIYHFILYKN